MKLFNIIGITLILVLLIINAWLQYKNVKPISNTTVEKTTEIRTTVPKEIRIVERNFQATKIDTVYITQGDVVEIGYLNTKIDTLGASIDLSISYNEKLNLFGISSLVTVDCDSVYVEKEIIKYITKKDKAIKPCLGISATMKDDNIETLGVDAGLKFFNKVSLCGILNTKKTLGVRIGIDF